MKKSFVLVFTLLTLTIFAFSEVKIGVFNSQEILQKTRKGTQVLKKLEDMKNAKEQQIQTLLNELEALDKELSSPALSTSARENKVRSLEDKKIVYDRTVQDAQEDLQKQSAQELGSLEKEIMPIIQQVGQTKGYTVVLDIANSGIAYFDATTDITADVIKAVDEKLLVK
ncbi:MAG TPA: OmpH family outer membrane protein [Candidatus Kapabacteria bacterium]|nr:OmpH family outer membrane protein [Candidatus Kapabacteria bacterium]